MDRLLEEVEVVEIVGDPAAEEISAIVFDSRLVGDGALFCCLVGQTHDGHDYAAEAVARGAAGLLVERRLNLAVTQAVVAPGTARAAMARLACALEGNPSLALVTVGVTGTNGKTSVTHLLGAVFEAHGWPTTVIGTLDGARTTPEAPQLQRLLADARDDGRRAVAMEVSSHALTQSRVDGTRFAAAVFTNLSHDHLDHHHTMEEYFAAKASLFTPERSALGVVNADDPWGRRLLETAAIPLVTWTSAEATAIASEPGRTAFTWRSRRVELRLTGTFHVANALAAAVTAVALGVPEDTVVAGLSAAGPVSGRFEVVAPGAPFTVAVDYAHTPDGLRAVLDSARRLSGAQRVICVFGCGGERDRAKRPEMGAAAVAGADVAVLTSDNPRGEDPRAIIDDVLAGVEDRTRVVVEVDRRSAIAAAVDLARPGDVVIVAGKGHEEAIEIGGRRVAFDDRLEAAAAVARRTATTAPARGERA